MLDRLLGRAALKERIAGLEAEVERLEARYEAEADRRADAVSDRQAADERVNRLEDRIADLEGQLERARDDRIPLEFRGTERLGGARLREMLDRLGSYEAGPEGALTAMVDGALPDEVREAFGDRSPLVRRAAPCVAVTDDAGIVSAAIEPAIPPTPFCAWEERFRLDPGWFLPTGSFAMALVRADLFALGEYDGDDLTAFEGFESDVKGAHSKGGFSQGRFERRRDEQIETHLERCREAIVSRETDRLIVVGERTLLGEFEEEAVATAPVDATGRPREALDTALGAFFTVTLSLI